MKLILTGLLLLSVLANLGAFFVIKQLYLKENLVRLNPLELAVYPTHAAGKSARKRVVFFGDSRALSWPAPEKTGYEFINRGIGDQTSSQIRLRYQAHVAPLQADILVLQLCVNDLKIIPLQPNLGKTIIQQCQRNLQAIVEQGLASGSRVVVSTVFPLGEVPLEKRLFWSDEVAAAILEVNHYIRGLASDRVTVFDSFALLQATPDLINSNYSRDLLHLNAQGYAALNEKLLELL